MSLDHLLSNMAFGEVDDNFVTDNTKYSLIHCLYLVTPLTIHQNLGHSQQILS